MAERVGWGVFLVIEAEVKVFCVVLTSLVCSSTTSYVGLLGDAFGIIILSEFGPLASMYFYSIIEMNDMETV